MSMWLLSRGCVSGGILSLHPATHTTKTHKAGEDAVEIPLFHRPVQGGSERIPCIGSACYVC